MTELPAEQLSARQLSARQLSASQSRFLDHDWFPSPLPPNVEIGERSWLYSTYALVHYQSEHSCGLKIGHDTGVYRNTFFNVGPTGQVEIGKHCTLAGPVISTNSRVAVADYVLISQAVIIADSFRATPPQSANRHHLTLEQSREKINLIQTDRELPQDQTEAPRRDIVIEDDAWIGSRAVLLGGAHLGRGVIVGAAAVVDFKVPDYAIVAGNPARIVGWAKPK